MLEYWNKGIEIKNFGALLWTIRFFCMKIPQNF